MSLRIDREKTKKTIALVLDKIKTKADNRLLDEYHSLFKKEVSLFHRSRAAAFLLMLCDQGKSLRVTPKNGRRFSEEDASRYPLTDKESKWLFFSAGRSRRVFPREILGLINTKTNIPREDIGVIRILDNYSFVQIRDTAAEKIIEALNGTVFRGKPLAVNYAKSRKDAENEPYGEDDPASLEQNQNHSEEENI